MTGDNIFIKADTANEVLKKIELISDEVTKRALLSLLFWRLATEAAVKSSSSS